MKSIWLLAALSAVVAPAFADPFRSDDQGWLETMAFAAHQTNYTGIFVYQHDGHVEISRITHVVDETGEHSRLEGLDGVRREVIRNNDQVLCYVGDRKVKVEQRLTARSFPTLLPERISLLHENYVITQVEEARVAGFHAHAVIFQPKDNLRYVHKMWAHSDSGLLLKAAVLDEHGGVIEQYAFTQLNLGGDIDRKWISVNKDSAAAYAEKSVHSTSQPSQVANVNSGWQVDALPPGFKKITEMRHPLRNKKIPAIHMVFSDGLAGISIFIEKLADNPDANPGLISHGAIHIYSKVVNDDHLVTVVGEVPPNTVIQVADSVRYAGE